MREGRAFDTTYFKSYIIGYYLDAVCKIGKFDNFEAFLHHVIAIDVLNEIDTVWFDELDQILLHILMIFGKFYGFLHHPASVAVLRELKNMILDDLEESMFMCILSVFKELLEDIIPELIFG